MQSKEIAILFGFLLATLAFVASTPTASACTISLGACTGACFVNGPGSTCSGACFVNVGASCSGACFVNGPDSTCSGACFVNGIQSFCGKRASCTVNGMASTCHRSCPLNVLFARCG